MSYEDFGRKLFVVTVGDYEGTRVLGVTSDRESAIAIARHRAQEGVAQAINDQDKLGWDGEHEFVEEHLPDLKDAILVYRAADSNNLAYTWEVRVYYDGVFLR